MIYFAGIYYQIKIKLMRIFSYEWIRKTLLTSARYPVSFYYRARGMRFACKALQGESSYNIAVNSDYTVSCNCNDYYKKGQIGNLSEQTFEEIFKGEKACQLRHQLSKGRFPLFQCVLCIDLLVVPKNKANEFLSSYRLPYIGIMVENTIQCNLNCISCPRESIINVRKSKRLSLSEIEKIAIQLEEMQMQTLAYFNLGEPFFYDSILDELQILKKYNPKLAIVLSTNGSMVDSDKKREAAMLLAGLCFSIDGVNNDIANKYQRGINFEKAYENLKKLVEYRNTRGLKSPTIEWKYVLFRWNDKEWMINKAIEMARDAGVDKITFWPSLSPPWSFSRRWYLGKFKNVGTPFPNGRVVDFIKN